MGEAFSPGEQARIVPTELSNRAFGQSGAQNTLDQVFLLNDDEYGDYIEAEENGIGWPTDCVREKLCRDEYDYSGADWWLRSPGKYNNYAAFITGGYAYPYGAEVTCEDIAVRPAMWIDLEIEEE